jgi:transposase
MSPNGRTPDVDHTLRCEDPTCNPRKARRKPLADHLTCEEVCIDVGTETCACCGGALHPIGEDISEMLDWCPRSSVSSGFAAPNTAAALAELRYAPVPGRGLTTSARLARVSGRQLLRSRALVLESQISARHDVELDCSTLAGWVGSACWWLARKAPCKCPYVGSSSRRRYARPGVRSRSRQGRAALGVRTQSATVGWIGTAGRCLRVRAPSQVRAASGTSGTLLQRAAR